MLEKIIVTVVIVLVGGFVLVALLSLALGQTSLLAFLFAVIVAIGVIGGLLRAWGDGEDSKPKES